MAMSRLFYLAWGSMIRQTFEVGDKATTYRKCFGWKACACIGTAFDQVHFLYKFDTTVCFSVKEIKRASSMLCTVDKVEHFHGLAYKAAVAACNGDSKTTYFILRSLKGYRPRPIKFVFISDGAVSKQENQRLCR